MNVINISEARPVQAGLVYVLRNPAFRQVGKREYLKVGRTDDVDRRLSELGTATPAPFHVVDLFEVPNAAAYERAAHDALSTWRVSGSEFFLIEPDRAVSLLEGIFGLKPRRGLWARVRAVRWKLRLLQAFALLSIAALVAVS